MSDYLPQSSIGWLDHSVKDGQRVRELITAFSDRQSVDNLGIGMVRDAISEQLFPGISTIQTRARYFLFIPWICRRLEAERVGPADFSRRYRTLELALIERLRDSGETRGVIGIEARANLKRLAIEVYWGGLGAFGIRRIEGSIADYSRGLPSLYRLQRSESRDDDGNLVGEGFSAWDAGLPEAPGDFYDRTDLTLTEDEATFLAASMRRARPGTLVAALAGANRRHFDALDIWHLPADIHPPGQRELIEHAELFAVAVQPARALYNLLLARRSDHARAEDVEAIAAEELDQWRLDRQRLLPALDRWIVDLDRFWLLADPNRSIEAPRRASITRLVEMCHAHPDDLDRSAVIHREIASVERDRKGTLARLSSDRALETWTGQAFGVGYLDYRWRTAQVILADIAEAMS